MKHDVSALLEFTDAMHIIDILAAGGYETRFIGGCVRDTLLKRFAGDIDLATTALPEETMRLLSAQNIHIVPTGLEHGTVMAVLNGQGYEITTLRHDVVTDGRHAQVAFTDDWAEDARRRDFTVNALSVDHRGKLYDYFDGLDDLAAKRLRFIDDAASRIAEDYLRLLRLFRFASVLGWDIHDTELLELCGRMAIHMKQLSRERIQAELYKLLAGVNALPMIELMDEYNLFQAWTEKINIVTLSDVIERETKHGLSDSFRRFIAMIGYDNRMVIDDMVVMSKQQKKRLHDIEHYVENNAHDWLQEKFCYLYGLQATEDCLMLFAPENWNAEFLSQWSKPEFPLKAEHILPVLGKADAFLGFVLKQSEAWWIAQRFQPDHHETLAYAQRVIEENSQD